MIRVDGKPIVVLGLGLALAGMTGSAPSAVAADPPAGPRIEISPGDNVILGDPVRVRVTGLPAGARVTLKGRILDRQGTIWQSEALFEADAAGTFDLGRDAPLDGTYEGVDPIGIFWSMRVLQGLKISGKSRVAEKQTSTVLFQLLAGDQVVAERVHRRWLRRPGVVERGVRDNGLVATFLHPDGRTPRPGVILVGGSSGGNGWQEGMAELLASHGYASLALAYFGMQGLPENLERIPLEYFGRAIDWMEASPLVSKKRLAFIGVSKGGELALLAGSRFPSIGAVVAYVPSSVVFQSIAPGYPKTSSWTYEERGLPFVPYMLTDRYRRSGELVDLYSDSLLNRIAVETARILVERIRGPVLLLTGKDDTLWPSSRMATEIMARLEKFDHPYPDRHFAYNDAGHLISRYPWFPSADTTRRGGTRRGNALATADSWRKLLAFLDRHM